MRELIDLIESKSPGSKPLLLVIRGSQAYGTNLPTSDIDYSGVFIQPMNDILSNKYKEQINDDNNDTVLYELRRFLELLEKNNPTVLELLSTPNDCILYKHPLFDKIIENKEKFITKICANSFGGYSRQQISKAKGQNKKQNWELDKVTRKTPLDFCYLLEKDKSISLSKYLIDNGLKQEFAGLSKTPHSKDTYSLFYDYDSQVNLLVRSNIYRGISFEDSNDIRLSSIPIDKLDDFIAHISYNKDGYTQHCNDYKSYMTWLDERNETRWVDVVSHGQKIDGKNMMHCVRLTQMAKEIAQGRGIIVRRENKDQLISIRKGAVDLETLINETEKEILEIDKLFKESNLPESVDPKFISDLILDIRKEFYNI